MQKSSGNYVHSVTKTLFFNMTVVIKKIRESSSTTINSKSENEH